jgi:hypothetical protein
MKMIISNEAGEPRFCVKGRGWVPQFEITRGDEIKCRDDDGFVWVIVDSLPQIEFVADNPW